jgi:hypothetical protein
MTIYQLLEKHRKNPFVLQDTVWGNNFVLPDDFYDDMYEGAELKSGFGGVTQTSFKKGNIPWNKDKTGVQPWTQEQKDAQALRAKEWHKKMGHVEGGKPRVYKGHARVDNTSELNKTVLECPHCGKTGNVGNMKRWHYDNCRSKRDC